MIEIRDERPTDISARELLLDTCFGPARYLKTSERLREGRLPVPGLSLTAELSGRVVGTVRLWHVEAGPGRPALLLGPLAVDPLLQGHGLGSTLMWASIGRARALGHGAIILVGDAPYYARFGFSRELMDGISLPGPFERARFLGLNLRRGSLDGAVGTLTASGLLEEAACPVGLDARRHAA
ncbi:N-acetyltransferase [Methylobacterium sp. 77]|uniref:GNAT family N-acetyltransferase n=1 Tax=Methylobacterium sp. 77 TaxID=1101192 RepID=UPI000378944F|nr:N-acetyltransferase [Methylobacterium sp. 77]